MVGTRECWQYGLSTYEYLGKTLCYEDPIETGLYTLPPSCTFSEPPEHGDKEIPVYDPATDSWTVKQDHRKHLDETGTYAGGTPYWLPEEGDDWQSEPRYMSEIGDLPEGAVLERPETPQSAIRKEELEQEIEELKRYLEDTDYVTLKILEEPDTADSYAEVLAKRKTARASIDPLQSELDSLENG